MIKPDNTWHSPLNVYRHIQKLAKRVGADEIETNRDYQLVREARIGAVVALAMFEQLGRPTYLQLYKPDPPDVILMQQTGGTRDITQVEITTYAGTPKEPLLELIRRKDPPGYHKYSENYILVVNLGIGLQVDFKPINEYLLSNETPFPVWVVQQIPSFHDTVAELTVLNPETYVTTINVGKATYIFKELGLSDVIHSKRTGSLRNVREVPTTASNKAPWETIGE